MKCRPSLVPCFVKNSLEDSEVRRQGQFEVHHFSLGRMQGHVSQFVGQGEDGLRVGDAPFFGLLHHCGQFAKQEGVWRLCTQKFLAQDIGGGNVFTGIKNHVTFLTWQGGDGIAA